MLATRPHKQGECNQNVCPQIRGLQAGGKPLTSHDAASQALTCPSTAELGLAAGALRPALQVTRQSLSLEQVELVAAQVHVSFRPAA
jgi:hypothetical protein